MHCFQRRLILALAACFVLSCTKPPSRWSNVSTRSGGDAEGDGQGQQSPGDITNPRGGTTNPSGGTTTPSGGTITPSGGTSNPGPDGEAPNPGGSELGKVPGIQIVGRQLMVNGKAYKLKSVCYNPIRKGQTHPAGELYNNPSAADLQLLEKDFKLMHDAQINTIRPYEAILDDRVLALLVKYDLKVIVPALNYFQMKPDQVAAIVAKLKDQPSTLMWELGNEWNYNHLYGADTGFSLDAAKKLIKDAAAQIKGLDKTHPISSVHGDLPPKALVDELADIDVWGLNVYAGLSFGDRFQRWAELSAKPMYIGEYGADAINVKTVDVNSQATADFDLSMEISKNLSANDPKLPALGGSIFEWNDEWWKDGKGSPASQDIGGIAPGGGPFPDSVFNEEWWGIVDIERKPRPAYDRLKDAYSKF